MRSLLMASCAVVLFFAVTGLTLNHADWFSGAEESAEFHRQSTLMGAHWPLACERELIDVPGCNHLSVCDAFADSKSELFLATRVLLSR